MLFINKALLSFILLISFNVLGQTGRVYHEVFSKQDGFDIDIVKAMNFDTDGFLWLGGENLDIRKIIANDKQLVLQRFNGSSFHSIPLPEVDQRILSINQIHRRHDGKFYIRANIEEVLHEQILFLFDPYTTGFEKINISESLSASSRLSKIFNYQHKDYVLSQNEEDVTLLHIDNELVTTPLFSFKSEELIIDLFTNLIAFEDFIVLSDNQVNIRAFDWHGNDLKKFSNFDNEHDWIDEVFTKDGITYVFLYNNPDLYYIDENSKQILLSKSNTKAIESDNLIALSDQFNNNLVLSEEANKVHFNSFNGETFRNVMPSTHIDHFNEINAASNNLKNELWIATGKQELHYFKLPSNNVKTFLLNKSIRSIIALSKEEYLVATEFKGWFVVNIISGEVNPYKVYENKQLIHPYSSRNLIIDHTTLWSNHQGRIIRKELNSPIIESWKHTTIICMERPNDSLIIYGTVNYKLMAFNTKSKKHLPLIDTDSLWIYDIAIHDNILVGATDKGVLTYNLKSKQQTFYDTNNGLEDEFMLMVDYLDDYGFLLGSRSGNILNFNPENESFSTIYTDDLKAGIATIVPNDDYLWINTFNGFVAFDTKKQSATRFSAQDGFSHNEANRYSALNTGEGIFVGTLNGLNYFKPEDLKPQKDSTKLVLLKIRKYDKSKSAYTEFFNRAYLDTESSIVIPAENRALELDFSLNNNAISRAHSYRYRLNDDAWINLKSQQTIQLANLTAGHYKLEIEAQNFSGEKIASSLFLNINSKSFFYKTWWFYLLLSLASISILLWILKQSQIRKLLQEQFSHALLQSQENERTRIAKELHDSIGQQLTLIKKKAQNDAQNEITSLAHNTLEEVRSISRGLYPAMLKQLGLKESIEQLIYEYDGETNIFFTLEIDDINSQLNENECLNFYRFIQECITNIIKHAEAKSVYLKIKKQKKQLLLILSDDGKGFNPYTKENQNSLGLKTIKERIRILKGIIQIDSKLNKGTVIKAKIPLKT